MLHMKAARDSPKKCRQNISFGTLPFQRDMEMSRVRAKTGVTEYATYLSWRLHKLSKMQQNDPNTKKTTENSGGQSLTTSHERGTRLFMTVCSSSAFSGPRTYSLKASTLPYLS